VQKKSLGHGVPPLSITLGSTIHDIERCAFLSTVVLASLCLVCERIDFGLGLLLGGVTCLLNFRNLCVSARRALKTGPEKAIVFTKRGYLFRMTRVLLILALSLYLKKLSFLGVLSGFLTFKVALYSCGLGFVRLSSTVVRKDQERNCAFSKIEES